MQAQREDGGAFFLEKVAQQYVRKGEKSFNIGQFNSKYFLIKKKIIFFTNLTLFFSSERTWFCVY
jgi:hypothetical protein